MRTLKKYGSPFAKIGIAVLLVLILLLIKATWNVYRKSVQTEHNKAQVAEEMKELEKRKAYLENETARLATIEGQDEEIRRQFGFAEDGERVFIILDPEPATTTEEENDGFWSGLWSWLTGGEE